METRADACMMMGEFSFVASKRVVVLKKIRQNMNYCFVDFFYQNKQTLKVSVLLESGKNPYFHGEALLICLLSFPSETFHPDCDLCDARDTKTQIPNIINTNITSGLLQESFCLLLAGSLWHKDS